MNTAEIETVDTSFVACATMAADGEAFLKATPHTEGDDRFLFIEPTNEDRDVAGEQVPRVILAKSAGYFLKFGNIDISHKTHPKIVRDQGIENPREWEIGKPIDVKVDPRILVKAQIYEGHEKADWFWKTQVGQRPPMTWWPSIGGASVVGPDGVVTQALWDNIGLDNRPVNKTVPHVTIVPPSEFLKALVGDGGTDKAQLAGGAAMRRESLHGATPRDAEFYRLSSKLIDVIKSGNFYLGEDPTNQDAVGALQSYFRSCGASDIDAADYARRFVMAIQARRADQQPAVASFA